MIESELEDLETRNLHLIENWQVSGKVSSVTAIRNPNLGKPFQERLSLKSFDELSLS